MKRPDGVTIIAVYEFLSAIPGLIGLCAILVFAVPGTLAGGDGIGDAAVALFVLGIVLLLIGAGALLSVITGWGLLGLKGWARWLAIVLAALSLPLFPIGTIIGVLIIWYLLKDEVRQAFEAAA
jgi:hypothetical protein